MIEAKYQKTLKTLISQELSKGNNFQFTVSTLSMSPLVRPQDAIIVRKESLDNLRCGDIIVFERLQELCTHRFLSKKVFDSSIKLITKGDNSLVIDKPVAEQNFIGKVIVIKKEDKVINLESTFWKIIGGLIGALSYIEWKVYNFLRKIKKFILRFE